MDQKLAAVILDGHRPLSQHRSKDQMKTNSLFLTLAVLSGLSACAANASPLLYNNDFGGVTSGDALSEESWNITNNGVSNSFSLSADATVTGFKVAV